VERPTLIWLDLTRGISHADPDQNVLDHFNLRYISSPDQLEDEPNAGEAICFEFDYPDLSGLSVLRSIKDRYPQYPVFMLTIGHSERLAIWAYRNRVMDYLVKPVSRTDLLRCKRRLLSIRAAAMGQNIRDIISYSPKSPINVPANTRSSGNKLAPALEFVQQNFRRRIRNDEVAELCGMSACKFSRAFAAMYALTFLEFLLRYRIVRACRELQHPHVPVTDVAYSVGFNEPSYFARVFRRYLGMSPSEYREQSRRIGFDRRRTHLLAGTEVAATERQGIERRQKADWRNAEIASF